MKILMAGAIPSYSSVEKNKVSLGQEGGGVGTALFNLAKGLVNNGVEVEILAYGIKNLRGEVEGIPTIISKDFQVNLLNNMKTWGTQKSPAAYRRFEKLSRNFFQEEEFDIYHSHGGGQFCVGPTFAAKALNIPSLMTIHAHWPVCFYTSLSWNGGICDGCDYPKFLRCTFKQGIKDVALLPIFLGIKNKSMAMRGEAMNRADKLITVSKYLKEILVKFGVDKEKTVPIYNIFEPKRKPKWEYLPNFCCVGRIVKDKGFEYAIKAMKKVVGEYPETKLSIIGEENRYTLFSEKKRLMKLAEKLGVRENIEFTGWIAHEKVLDYISHSSGVVFPSVGPEPFPMTVLEGMGCGRPVIATKRGGIPEVIEDNKNGFEVTPNDSEKIANKMIYLLDNPNEIKKIGKESYQTIKNRYNSVIIAKKHIKLYRNLL